MALSLSNLIITQSGHGSWVSRSSNLTVYEIESLTYVFYFTIVRMSVPFKSEEDPLTWSLTGGPASGWAHMSVTTFL